MVSGFHTRQQALQFEYAWRRVHRRKKFPYTITGRRGSLSHLRSLERWSRNAISASLVALTVTEHHGEMPIPEHT